MKNKIISNIDPTYGHYLRRRPGKQSLALIFYAFFFSKYIIFD